MRSLAALAVLAVVAAGCGGAKAKPTSHVVDRLVRTSSGFATTCAVTDVTVGRANVGICQDDSTLESATLYVSCTLFAGTTPGRDLEKRLFTDGAVHRAKTYPWKRPECRRAAAIVRSPSR